jgi:hypothetical protein
MSTLLIVIIVLLLLGAFSSYPAWDHSRDWGYAPSSGLGLILVVVLILFLLGRI